jgi:hypothetical protein
MKCHILIKFGVLRRIFVEVAKIKFKENRPVETALIKAASQTDRRMDRNEKGNRRVSLFILTSLERTVRAPRTKFIFDFTRDIFRKVARGSFFSGLHPLQNIPHVCVL